MNTQLEPNVAPVALREAPAPPSPSRFFGHLREFAADPLGVLDSVRENYDDVVRLRFVNVDSYTFIQPKAVRHILQENHTNYDKATFDFQLLKRLLGNGLVTNDGPGWLRQRRLIQPAFSRKRIADYGVVMSRCVDDFVRDWRDRDGQVVDVAEEMMRLTLRIVGLALFSRDLLGEAESVGRDLTRANRLVTRRILAGYPPFLYGPLDLRLFLASWRLRRGVERLIDERLDRPDEHGDLLSTLLGARDAETGRGMSRRQLRDEVLTLLMAGHETTANTLAWTLHLLGENPTAAARLEEEVASLPGNRPLTPADVAGTPFVWSVIKESMRLRPAVWSVGRRAIREDVIQGFRVPAGAVVFISQYVTHRHPSVWEQPLEFLPERFAPEREREIQPFAFFPFGGGPRLCIGQDFALLESALILATIARHFRLEAEAGHVVRPEPLVTLRPKTGVRMRIRAV